VNFAGLFLGSLFCYWCGANHEV